MLTDIIRFRAALQEGARRAAARQPIVSCGPRDFVELKPTTDHKD